MNRAASGDQAGTSWLDRLEEMLYSDRLNPVFSRELRRMVKSRTFAITFQLVLLLCWLSYLALVLNTSTGSWYMEQGLTFCSYLFVILALSSCLVIPVVLFALAAEERQESTLEMVVTAGITPEQILSGLLSIGMLQALLYASAILPFIAISYVMQGVDLLALLLTFGLTLFGSLASSVMGMTLGACVRGPTTRAILGGLNVLGSFILFILTASCAQFMLYQFDDLPSIMAGGVCVLAFLAPILAILLGLAINHLRMTDPMIKPYRVLLDENGDVKKFIPRYQNSGYQSALTEEEVIREITNR
ncbi:MAG: hypothetical protein KDA78_09595 [Planctomycetaceae bacterium]|nr:hypothetical protein [Planctomycetaceae bacterium]